MLRVAPRRSASLLVTAEVALALMLLIGAGLLLKSFSRLTHVDPGFNASHLLIMRTDFTRQTMPPERMKFYCGTARETGAVAWRGQCNHRRSAGSGRRH